MTKKIAFILILFMLGPWGAYADRKKVDSDPDWYVYLSLGAGTVLTILSIYFLAIGDVDASNAASDAADAWLDNNRKKKRPRQFADNPIINNTALYYHPEGNLFVGIRFGW